MLWFLKIEILMPVTSGMIACRLARQWISLLAAGFANRQRIAVKRCCAACAVFAIALYILTPHGLATAVTTLTRNEYRERRLYSRDQNLIGRLSSHHGVIVLSLLGIGLFIWVSIVAYFVPRKGSEALRQIVVALRIDGFNQPGLAIGLIHSWRAARNGDTRTLVI